MESAYIIFSQEGKNLGSVGARQINFGMENVTVPAGGQVSVPLLNPSIGSDGVAKYLLVNNHNLEKFIDIKENAKKRSLSKLGSAERSLARKRQAPAASSSARPSSKQKPPEPMGPPPVAPAEPAQPLTSSGHGGYDATNAFAQWEKRPRQGWLMETKDAAVAYKKKQWQYFESLMQEPLDIDGMFI